MSKKNWDKLSLPYSLLESKHSGGPTSSSPTATSSSSSEGCPLSVPEEVKVSLTTYQQCVSSNLPQLGESDGGIGGAKYSLKYSPIPSPDTCFHDYTPGGFAPPTKGEWTHEKQEYFGPYAPTPVKTQLSVQLTINGHNLQTKGEVDMVTELIRVFLKSHGIKLVKLDLPDAQPSF